MAQAKPRRAGPDRTGLSSAGPPAKGKAPGAKLAMLLRQGAESSDVSAADLRHNSAEIVSRVAVGGERLVLTRNGKPVAALVPMDDLAALKKLPKRS